MGLRELWTLYIISKTDSTPRAIKVFTNKIISGLVDSAIEQGLLSCNIEDVLNVQRSDGTILDFNREVIDQVRNFDMIRVLIREDTHTHTRRPSLGYPETLHFTCGDHICWMVDNDDLELEILTSYVIDGIQLNQKVMIVAPSENDEERLKPNMTMPKLKELLKARQFDIDPHIQSGQLAFVYADTIGLHDRFSPEEMLVLFKQAAKQALQEGYTALRATGDRCWTLHEIDQQGKPTISRDMFQRVIHFEKEFNKVMAECPNIIGLCRYDKRRFSEEFLDQVLTIHPQAAVNNKLFDNFYYIPPEKYDQSLPFSQRVANLAERQYVDIEMKQAIKDITKAKQQLERTLEEQSKSRHDGELLNLFHKQRSQFIAQMSHEIRSPLNGIIGSVSLLSNSPLAVEYQEVVQSIETSTQELLHILTKVLDPNYDSTSTLKTVSPLTLPDVPPSPRKNLDTFFKQPFFHSSPPTSVPSYSLSPLLPSLSPSSSTSSSPSPSPSPSPSSSSSSSPFPSPSLSSSSFSMSPLNLSTYLASSVTISASPIQSPSTLSPSFSACLSDSFSSPILSSNPLQHSRSSPALGYSSKISTAFTEVSNLFPRLLHILVVDDNEINRRVLERMIARFDKVVYTSVNNGQEAVKACEGKLFDVILMDLYMPVLNGIDASREIMNISRTRRRKPIIVAVTASVTDEIKKECIDDVGMAGFISKPIDVKVFLKIFTSILPKLQE